MRTELKEVKEFMVACAQPVRSTPQLIPVEEATLRVAMLKEEVKELEEAIVAGDLVEIFDAFLDIEYINNGGILQFGLGDIYRKGFREVQRSNMAKVVKGKVIRNEAGKIQKPEGWTAPNINAILNPTPVAVKE